MTPDQQVDEALAKLRSQGDAPQIYKPQAWNKRHELKPFQRVGAAHLMVKKCFILGDPTGVGKTPQELYSWAAIKEKKEEPTNLWVVTTRSAVSQWADEVEKFLPGTKVYQLRSDKMPKLKRVEIVDRWADQRGAVLIGNWSQFKFDWELITQESKPTEWLSRTQITLDEVQRISNSESFLGKVAKEIIELADRVHGLTATLVHNNAHGAHAIIQAISPGTMGLLEFERKYCIKDTKWFHRKGSKRRRKAEITVGYHHLEDFRKRIAHVYLGRTDEELEGQRPDISFMRRTVSLSPSARKVYLEAEQGMLIDEEKKVTSFGPMVHAQQAANNPEIWYDKETNLTVKTKDNVKAKLLRELLTGELEGDAVILYSPLETTISAYQEHLKDLNPVRVTGKEDEDEREVARKAFQDGKNNIIMITDAGGEALNLQRAKHVIFISRPWAPGTYTQVVGRARRFESPNESIIIWHLIAEDTIDEFVDAVLSEKYGPVEEIVRGRGKLVPEDQVLPKEIAEYARKKRLRS